MPGSSTYYWVASCTYYWVALRIYYCVTLSHLTSWVSAFLIYKIEAVGFKLIHTCKVLRTVLGT